MRKPIPPPKPPNTPLGGAPLDWRKIVDEAVGAVSGEGGGGARAARLTETVAFGANPGALKMYRHIPDDLPARPALVVVLHGCGQSAAAYVRGAGWATLADRFGFVVLAPEQTPAGNGNGCFSWFDPARGRREAASIRQMIEWTVAALDVDPARVFVTGLSAGGAMTSFMLAAYPEVFAAGAVIAGLPHGAATNVQSGLAAMRAPPPLSRREWGDVVREASEHRGPWPRVSVWHGDADHTVGAANAEAILAQWGELHGLAPLPDATDRVDGYPRRVWRNAGGAAVMESYSLTGLGHGTPIAVRHATEACGAPGAFILEAGISSSWRIASFWGLTGAAASERTDLVERPVQAEPEVTYLDFQPVPPEPANDAPRGRLDPGVVINKALRAAGLM